MRVTLSAELRAEGGGLEFGEATKRPQQMRGFASIAVYDCWQLPLSFQQSHFPAILYRLS